MKVFNSLALEGNLTMFKNLEGSHLLERLKPFYVWKNNVSDSNLWWLGKRNTSKPTNFCQGTDADRKNSFNGINFASQDYLSLASHPEVKEAAIKAIIDDGFHSAGSPALFGETKQSLKLEEFIANFLGKPHVSLYPTGWAAVLLKHWSNQVTIFSWIN
jgi:glycine C-acetyltransferase